MKDLYKLVCDAVDECEDVGIEVGIISSIVINSRAQRRWGRCHKLGDSTYEIEISSKLLNDEVDYYATKNTVVHEVLHTCDGCMNHGPLWKSYAERMNKAYGYNIKRTTSSEEKGIKRTYKHTVICDNCGQVYHANRMTQAFKAIKNYPYTSQCKCGRCHQATLRYRYKEED